MGGRTQPKARNASVRYAGVMPNHLHVLLTVGRDMTIEKAMQLIKGGFSYRLKKEFGYVGEVWQRGFSEMRITDQEGFSRCRECSKCSPKM
jgi:putative transposase